jgi:hypothetical protein
MHRLETHVSELESHRRGHRTRANECIGRTESLLGASSRAETLCRSDGIERVESYDVPPLGPAPAHVPRTAVVARKAGVIDVVVLENVIVSPTCRRNAK